MSADQHQWLLSICELCDILGQMPYHKEPDIGSDHYQNWVGSWKHYTGPLGALC